MKISDFPSYVSKILRKLTSEPSALSIWFIGSRANGTDRPDSDWDFILFVNDEICEKKTRHKNVDIIRVDKNGQYLLEGQKSNMVGSFNTWKWREESPILSSYTVRKTPNVPNGQTYDTQDIKYQSLKGIKIWQKNA